jgi:hypothetical protein
VKHEPYMYCSEYILPIFIIPAHGRKTGHNTGRYGSQFQISKRWLQAPPFRHASCIPKSLNILIFRFSLKPKKPQLNANPHQCFAGIRPGILLAFR